MELRDFLLLAIVAFMVGTILGVTTSRVNNSEIEAACGKAGVAQVVARPLPFLTALHHKLTVVCRDGHVRGAPR